MPKNTRHIKAIEDKLHFTFPESWWNVLADELDENFGDPTLAFKIRTDSLLAKIGHLPPFKAWAITIGNTIHLTRTFGWGTDWREKFGNVKLTSPNLKTIFSVIAHEAYHVKDQKRVGFWKWMLKYSFLRPAYTAKSHPMEKPAYQLAHDIKQKLT